MPLYEMMFIARQDLAPQQVDELTAEYTKIFTENGGKIVKTDNWGLRTLAYRINKNRKGHYVLLNLDTPAPALIEVERKMRLNEDILRYMSVRVEEFLDPSKTKDKFEEKEAA